MVRIGREVDFDGSRNTLNDALIKGIVKLGLTGINWSFVDDDTLNIYGEDVDLTTLKVEANARGFVFDVIGPAPAEPIPDPGTPPTPDEITALAEMRTAFNTVIQARIDEFWTDVETEYDLIKTTAELFRRFTDIKHLRQQA